MFFWMSDSGQLFDQFFGYEILKDDGRSEL